MEIIKALDQLAEYQFQLDALRLREEELIATLTPKIPDEIKNQINDVHAEFATQRSGAETNAAELKEEIKAAIIEQGVSHKGAHIHAVYVKGRVSWDTKGVEGYALAHPELMAYRKEGEPSVTFRNI